MKYTTKTEYGLMCMIYITKNQEANRITIREIAAKENYPVAYMEKILQTLRHAGLVTSQTGNHGGYVLARKPSEITLKQIIEAIEGTTFEVFCAPEVREDIVCNHICMCGAKPIWRKTKDLLDHFYDSITLEQLAKPQADVQAMLVGAAK